MLNAGFNRKGQSWLMTIPKELTNPSMLKRLQGALSGSDASALRKEEIAGLVDVKADHKTGVITVDAGTYTTKIASPEICAAMEKALHDVMSDKRYTKAEAVALKHASELIENIRAVAPSAIETQTVLKAFKEVSRIALGA